MLVHFEDGRRFVNRLQDERYDLVLVLTADPSSAQGVRYVESDETPAYIADMDKWLGALRGQVVPLRLDEIDSLSGATISSRAALESVNRAALAGGEVAFGKSFGGRGMGTGLGWLNRDFLILLVLLIVFFPVYRSGRDGIRLLYQAAVLIVLGFWFNALVTEVDLVNISIGHLPSNPLRYLMIGFVVFTGLFLGQAYCGYVCPFGALQEFISSLGRFFYLRSYAARALDIRMRYVKFVLLAFMLVAFWLTEDLLWVSFNPMQYFFSGLFSGWLFFCAPRS
ncbi:MAG: 4Fe-4S binding protein [Pseudomonadota bacterium]